MAEYAATMVVWLRAMLDQEYGVPSDAVEWVVCRPPVVLGGPPAPAGIRVRTEYGAEPVDLLATGAVDAAFDFEGSRAPGLLEKGITGIFSNPWAEVERYYRATRIFPIMHLMVLRKDVHDAAPKLARELYEAFETAKEDAAQALQGTDGLPLMLPRLAQFLASEHALFGADLWPYGVQANSATLEAFVAHCHRQGLLSGDVSVPDLFVEELA